MNIGVSLFWARRSINRTSNRIARSVIRETIQVRSVGLNMRRHISIANCSGYMNRTDGSLREPLDQAREA